MSNRLNTQTDVASRLFRSPLRYPGGKQRAIRQIALMLPDSFHEYREPMVGGGSVYFHVRSANLAKKYWINDKFTELVAFWRVVQDPVACEKLQNQLYKLHRSLPTAAALKRYYLQLREQERTADLDIALKFFYFNRVSFSGTTMSGGFSEAASALRFTTSSIERLSPLPEALKNTKITNLDFRPLIEKPGRDVFIFLDPPYFTASKLYGRNGGLHDFPHQELSDLLKQTPHRFLITYDDCDEIRRLYSWANVNLKQSPKVRAPKIDEWQLTYGMNNCGSSHTCKTGSELFIANY